MKNIAIIGFGGFGREVRMLIDQINKSDLKYNFIGYFEDDVSIKSNAILGCIEDVNNWHEDLAVVVAIGAPSVRRNIISKITSERISFETLIHPSCIIGTDCKIGEGSILCAGTIITVNVEIGNHVIINLMTTIGHDSRIGSFTSVMPSVNISGEVIVEDAVYFGTGAKVINRCKISKGATIGAGAVVINDIAQNGTAVGVPAKVKNVG